MNTLMEPREIQREALSKRSAMVAAMLEAISSGLHVPDLNEIVGEVVRRFGGPSGIADHLFSVFIAAKPGSMIQLQAMRMVVEMTKVNTQMNRDTFRDVCDRMTEREQDEMFAALFRAAQTRRLIPGGEDIIDVINQESMVIVERPDEATPETVGHSAGRGDPAVGAESGEGSDGRRNRDLEEESSPAW